MSDNFNYREEEAFVNSIIGEGTRLSGEFDLDGLLRIDGEFIGKVRTKGKVLIGKSGVANCKIFAGTVVIGGKVSGDIFATERIILLSTGLLVGNIKTTRIVIEEGVIFDGTCEIIEDKDRFEMLKNEFLDKHFSSGEFYKKEKGEPILDISGERVIERQSAGDNKKGEENNLKGDTTSQKKFKLPHSLKKKAEQKV